ncbi:hypothetical protein VNO78_13892 [Psophocarpus tetragonolobus]|uniref:Uncharacterized protein n=1 Tax=Psophocarpus tetragonolobus TaxID=3891 RepID=A0AAN9XPT0_PSOTE
MHGCVSTKEGPINMPGGLSNQLQRIVATHTSRPRCPGNFEPICLMIVSILLIEKYYFIVHPSGSRYP